MEKVTREDFEPTNEPLSLKDLVREEVFGYQQQGKDGQYYPKLPDESLDNLMKRVYERIEREALITYHSSDIWALRQWCLENIFRDSVVDELTVKVVDEVMSSVVEWQGESYDPIAKYRQKLLADGKTTETVEVLLDPVNTFVGRKGRKKAYTDDDIREHFAWLRENGYTKKVKGKDGTITLKKVKYKVSTLANMYNSLRSFFIFLHGRDWDMPVKAPPQALAEDMDQPLLSHDEVERLIADTCIAKRLPVDWIVRLLVSTL